VAAQLTRDELALGVVQSDQPLDQLVRVTGADEVAYLVPARHRRDHRDHYRQKLRPALAREKWLWRRDREPVTFGDMSPSSE
jgi:hypothetical protein